VEIDNLLEQQHTGNDNGKPNENMCLCTSIKVDWNILAATNTNKDESISKDEL
jgi:hypothetical protein